MVDDRNVDRVSIDHGSESPNALAIAGVEHHEQSCLAKSLLLEEDRGLDKDIRLVELATKALRRGLRA